MRLEKEARDHSEVATPSAERPEEIRVLVLARRDEAAIGPDDVRFEQVVDRLAVFRVKYPLPPPSVRPATPVVETMPKGTARPNAWVA